MVGNTARPIVTTAVSCADVAHIRAIASLVAGGADALEARPFVLAYLEPMSPLRFDRDCVDKLLYCCDHAIPFSFAAGANLGTGAPITPEGGVVQGSAESLAGLVLALLRNPDAKAVYGSNTSCADMRSALVCYGPSEWARTVAMYADLGKYYEDRLQLVDEEIESIFYEEQPEETHSQFNLTDFMKPKNKD